MEEVVWKLGERESVYIVAEIGQNHQGSFETAKQMIREAKNCGVNCVKFQKSHLQAKFTESALTRPYSSENSFGKTYGEHKEFLELSYSDMKALKEYAGELKIDFGVSPMDPVSMGEMIQLKPSFIKIGSGDTNNFQMLRTAAASGLPVILSTGMQKESTIGKAVEILMKGCDDYAVLHCISSYPTDEKDINLSQMIRMKEQHPLVGYSGHELGFYPSLVAVMLGAKIVERHFTLDKGMKGSDHKCSLDSTDMKEFVDLVRLWESIPCNRGQVVDSYGGVDFFPKIPKNALDSFVATVLGSPRTDEIYPCERPCQDKLGKSLVYKRSLNAGSRLQLDDLCIKVSAERGLLPEQLEHMIGQELCCIVDKDEAMLGEHLKQESIIL